MPPIYLFPNPSAHAKHTPSTRRRAAPHSRVTCRLCAPSTPCWCYPLARAGTRCSPCVPPSPDCAEYMYGVRTACARCTRRAVCTRRRLRRRRHSPSCPPLSRVCRRYFFSSAGPGRGLLRVLASGIVQSWGIVGPTRGRGVGTRWFGARAGVGNHCGVMRGVNFT